MNETVLGYIMISDTMQHPVLSAYDLTAIVGLLSTQPYRFKPAWARGLCQARQMLARWFLDKTTADYLVFMDAGVRPHPITIDWMISEMQADTGLMAGLTFWWPDLVPNLQKVAGHFREDGYKVPQLVPEMDMVGRYAVKHQDQYRADNGGIFIQPGDHQREVESLNGGMFIVPRTVLSTLGYWIFHEFKGDHMVEFCRRVRLAGFKTVAMLNAVCTHMEKNHIDYLVKFGKPKESKDEK